MRRRRGLRAHVAAWSRALERAGAAYADVLHLHHLTPLHEAAARVAPGVPGRRPPARHRAAHARARSRDGARRDVGARGRLGRSACAAGPARSERLLVLSPGQVRARRAPARRRPGALRRRAQRLRPGDVRAAPVDRAALWRRVLVDEPRGWRPGGDGGLASGTGPPTSRSLARRAGAAGGRALHGGQARRPAHPRLRAGAGRRRAARRARARRRLPRASGRASTRGTSCGRPALATCSWPAGTTTTSCPSSCAAPTRSRSRRSRSSSARSSSRGWRAACRRRGRPDGPGGHRRRRTDGLARRARRRGGPGRGADRGAERPAASARRRAIAARADALARFSWPALGARLADLLDAVAARDATSAAGRRA